MIKRWKVVVCDWCQIIAPMEKIHDFGGSWWHIPSEWTYFDNKIYLCPTCSKAIYKVRSEIKKENTNVI